MAFDKDCPCNRDCKRRPNCKGCAEGEAWRKKKQEERDQRYKERTYHRYEMEMYVKRFNKSVSDRQKTKRFTVRKE